MKSKVWAIVGASLVVILLVVGGMWISASNQEKRLRNLSGAEQDKCKLVHDTMWKTIKQKANVTDEAYTRFKEVFSEIMSERYKQGGGSLAKFITESNPQFDMSLFQDLMRTIEGKRTEYMTAQAKLRDIKNQHDNLLDVFPSSLFVGGRPRLVITLVTSEITEGVYQQGTDNDVELFNKEKKDK